MKISIVIINYNGAWCIPACISSCVAEGVEAQDIVVVDNGSDYNSLALVRHEFPDVRIVDNACNAGFARAVNQGLREAGQELVLILNNDARLQSGAVAHLIRCAERFPDAALIGARLLDVQQRPQNVVAPFPRVWHELLPKFLLKRVLRSGPMGRMANVSEPMVVPTLIGAALLLRRSVLPILGLMDEDFGLFDGLSWGYADAITIALMAGLPLYQRSVIEPAGLSAP
jgi:GT2 family glycosyltransferase